MGNLLLRRNSILNFMENAAFDPKLITYDELYDNDQSHSPTFKQHMRQVLHVLKEKFPNGGKITEVGCGKGAFVELVQADGHFDIEGYDITYQGNNPRIHKRYLGADDRIQSDIIVLRHVLEHIQKPHLFLDSLRKIFSRGKIYIEVPDFDWIINNQAYFDVTYEHVNYFSRKALQELFDDPLGDAGPLFGGQYQYLISDIELLSVNFAIKYETGGWAEVEFEDLFPQLKLQIAAVENELMDNSNAYVWGAATKGCMFLHHFTTLAANPELIKFAIDTNTNKSGKFLPGSLTPIHSPAYFYNVARPHDLLLVSNPAYLKEIQNDLEIHKLGRVRVRAL